MTTTNALGQPVGLPVTVPLPRPRPPRTPLTGRYCSIEPVDVVAHHAALFDAFARDADARNWTYLPYGPFRSAAELRDWMDRTCAGDDPLFHTILDGEGVPSGLASFLRIDPAGGVIEIGHIHLSPRLQGTPASTEMQALMMGRVFDELGYRRYEWKCDALNAPSRRAAERLGFTYEGTFRQATVYKGRNRDTAWFALLDSEWPERKARFARWLDPDNFDASGRQRTALQGG